MLTKTCVIVGAGAGLSAAVARKFGENGFHLALIARRNETVGKLAHSLEKGGIMARGFSADAGDADSLREAFDHVKNIMGHPEVLIYNAAHLRQQSLLETNPDELIRDFTVNIAGAALSAQQVVPAMKKERHGTLLFTGGGLALNPHPLFASLAIGKSGLRTLTYCLAEELREHGIHVGTVTVSGTIEPGTHFDPETIADVYWRLQTQPADAWETEVVYK